VRDVLHAGQDSHSRLGEALRDIALGSVVLYYREGGRIAIVHSQAEDSGASGGGSEWP